MSVKNRCYGCKHFGGYRGDFNGSSTPVQCDLGNRGVSISQGCSSYTPDNTASCKGMSVCYYNKNKSYRDIECSIHGYVGESRDYCRDHAALEEDAKSKKKGGCFVTTAICEILDKDDNCYELETLRKFRDQVLLRDENLKSIVSEYYEISPSIVHTLTSLHFKKEFSRYLLHNHVRKIVKEIESNNNIEAINSYMLMLKEIMEKKIMP